jgi:phage shock protein PspC (stress-responsive transcriptional regulator)
VFTKIRALGVVRPDEGRWAAGVAAGLARRWGVDPVLVRGGFVALSLFFGVGLFLYGAGWLLLPHPDGRIHAQEVTHGTVTAGFVGSVLALLAGMPFGDSWSGNGPGFGWSFGPGVLTLAIVGAVAWWLFHRRERSVPSSAPAPSSSSTFAGSGVGSATAAYEPPVTHAGASAEPGAVAPTAAIPVPSPHPGTGRPRSANAPWRPLSLATLGLALLAGTLAYLPGNSWPVAGAAGLGVVGVGLVLSGLAGRRGGFLVPVAIVLALTALNTDTITQSGAAAGDQSWTPVTAAEAGGGFTKGAGTTVVDLTSTAVTAGATTTSPVSVPISQALGELTVIVPSGVAARVNVNAGAGSIDDRIHGTHREGVGNQLVVDTGTGSPVLVVSVNLGAGEIVVREAAPTAAVPTPLRSSS